MLHYVTIWLLVPMSRMYREPAFYISASFPAQWRYFMAIPHNQDHRYRLQLCSRLLTKIFPHHNRSRTFNRCTLSGISHCTQSLEISQWNIIPRCHHHPFPPRIPENLQKQNGSSKTPQHWHQKTATKGTLPAFPHTNNPGTRSSHKRHTLPNHFPRTKSLPPAPHKNQPPPKQITRNRLPDNHPYYNIHNPDNHPDIAIIHHKLANPSLPCTRTRHGIT